jgi:hypothetical protein
MVTLHLTILPQQSQLALGVISPAPRHSTQYRITPQKNKGHPQGGLCREKLPEASNNAFCQAVTPTELIRIALAP